MSAYQKLYGVLEGEFDGCELNYVAKSNNTEADELANIGSTRGPVHPGVFLECINEGSIKTGETEQPTNTEAGKENKPEQVAVANQASNEEDDGMTIEQDDEVIEGPAWTKPFL